MQHQMSNEVGQRSKSKENYSKNKTFEFPNNYLKSMINSNLEFLMEETNNPQKFNMTMIKGQSIAKKRISRKGQRRYRELFLPNSQNKSKKKHK